MRFRRESVWLVPPGVQAADACPQDCLAELVRQCGSGVDVLSVISERIRNEGADPADVAIYFNPLTGTKKIIAREFEILCEDVGAARELVDALGLPLSCISSVLVLCNQGWRELFEPLLEKQILPEREYRDILARPGVN